MAEEKQKKSSKVAKAVLGPIQALARIINKILRKILFNPVVVAVVVGSLMFAFGARLHETGNLAGFMEKDHKGATVLVTGVCKNLKGKVRYPALGADYVTVTSENKVMLKGVLRKTREVLECDKKDITYSAMPYELLRDVFKAPPTFPNMPPMMEKEEAPPEYMRLSKQTLVISGTCSKQDGQSLDPFTDKEVDVTDIRKSDLLDDGFDLYGIRREDQQAIKCLSTAIKYDLKKEGKDPVAQLEDEGIESVVGKILMVSGTCVPDKRVVVKTKYAFYKFANDQIQVLEEVLDENGKLKKFVGMVMNEKYRGESVVCDKTKWPFIYEEFDDVKHKLEGKSEAISNQEGE